MTPGLRYTALRIAGLHPLDRAWLLERLPVADADALRALATTPQGRRFARVAADIDPPVSTPAPVTALPATLAYRAPSTAVQGLDRQWASLLDRAADPAEAPLPTRLAASLNRWVAREKADA